MFVLFAVVCPNVLVGAQSSNRLPATNPPPIQSATTTQKLNGSTDFPRADQFMGDDFCIKLRAAEVAALASGMSLVDASHFVGVVQCSIDPFYNLVAAGGTINLTVLFPAARIETSVPWVINYSGLNVRGMGPFATQVEYSGTATASAIIEVSGTSASYVYHFLLADMFVYGGASNAKDGIYLTYAHHGELRNIDTWGVTGNGIHTAFAVTDTFYRPRTSVGDAAQLGIRNNRHATPMSGLYFDAVGALQTTDGTVIDAAAEGLKGTGWVLASANNMTFTSGTSEGNATVSSAPGGIEVKSSSTYNNFIGPDLEQNTSGLDMLNNGGDTYVRSAIMSSSATPYTEGSSASGTDLENGSFEKVNGTPARWVRFGYETFGTQMFVTSIQAPAGVILPTATLQGYKGPASGYVVLASARYDCSDGWDHLPCIVTNPSYSSQSSNIGPLTLFTSPSLQNASYRITCTVLLTQAATTRSTLPSCSAVWTDTTTGTMITGVGSSISTSNIVGTNGTATWCADVKDGTAIQFQTTSYASSGTTAMQYKLTLEVERTK
jgi:hypothetical protein